MVRRDEGKQKSNGGRKVRRGDGRAMEEGR